MADYERSATIGSSPEAVFNYLAEARNMPRYIALMTLATPAGDGLRVAAEVEGRHEEGDATFSADRAARRLDWGRAGSDYRGWLAVRPNGADGSSTVTIHLHTKNDADRAAIKQAIDDTMANIRSLAGSM